MTLLWQLQAHFSGFCRQFYDPQCKQSLDWTFIWDRCLFARTWCSLRLQKHAFIRLLIVFVFRVFFLESHYSYHRIRNLNLTVWERTDFMFHESLSSLSRRKARGKKNVVLVHVFFVSYGILSWMMSFFCHIYKRCGVDGLLSWHFDSSPVVNTKKQSSVLWLQPALQNSFCNGKPTSLLFSNTRCGPILI